MLLNLAPPPARAAQLFLEKGNSLEAARLFGLAGQWATSAELYEKSGYPLRAAESWEKDGKPLKAAQCYEKHFTENVSFSTTYSSTAATSETKSALQAGRLYEKAGQLENAVAAYGKGVAYVRSKPVEARQYLKGYTAIEGDLAKEVPLAAYTMYNEFAPKDIAYFQKFFDLFAEKGIFSSRLIVDTMIYKG